MLTRVSDYFEQFQCLAGECPHTCCAKWEVVIDEETACRYGQVSGELGEKLRSVLQVDKDGDFCFPLDGGRCPFLDGENLCQIHRQLGEEATSVTCREHPRFIEEYGPFQEITLSASCPEANRLLLGSRESLAFCEMVDDEAEEEGDEWLAWLLPLRRRMMVLLTDRRLPLRQRLGNFLDLAYEVQLCLEEERIEDIPALTKDWAPCAPMAAQNEEERLFPEGLRFLTTLEVLEPDWRELLTTAERAIPLQNEDEHLERIASYMAFRYLLKAVNDGDVLSRAELCVFTVLLVERLAAVCGLEEALRRFSCEIEHSGENLELLLEAFLQSETFSFGRFKNELSSI